MKSMTAFNKIFFRHRKFLEQNMVKFLMHQRYYRWITKKVTF